MTKQDVTFDLQDPVFSGDRFRMYEFKIKRCPKAKPHDWTQCPFAHPGEKAKRRDPRRFTYSGSACPEFRKAGICPRGDACPLAHGVFETWLHPTRYKTQMCMDGGACRRKVCFFAHSQSELRMAPPGTAPMSGAPFGMDPTTAGMSPDVLLQQAMLGQQPPQQQLELLHLLSSNPGAAAGNPNLLHLQHALGLAPPQPPAHSPSPQHDVAALLAAAGMPHSALTSLLTQQQGAAPPSIPMQGGSAISTQQTSGSPLSRTTSMASSLQHNQHPESGSTGSTVPQLYRHDSIMSTPPPMHDQAALMGPAPNSLHRHLSLDARHAHAAAAAAAYSPVNTTPMTMGSPAPDAALDPALTAVLQNLSLGGASLEPVCEATAVEHGPSSMTSSSLLHGSNILAGSTLPGSTLAGSTLHSSKRGSGFMLPHDYQLTSRSTVDNGVLAHMREIATTELSKLSDKELAALSHVYGGGGAHGDPAQQQHTPRATPSPSFAATTPTGAGVLSVATSLGGRTRSPCSQSPNTNAALLTTTTSNGEGVTSPLSSAGGVGSTATTPTSAALWTAAVADHHAEQYGLQQDIKRNFSIERLLSELPRSMSDMDVSQILAVQPAGMAVAGGAVQ